MSLEDGLVAQDIKFIEELFANEKNVGCGMITIQSIPGQVKIVKVDTAKSKDWYNKNCKKYKQAKVPYKHEVIQYGNIRLCLPKPTLLDKIKEFVQWTRRLIRL